MTTRVLVADDSLFMRTLISDMLDSDPDIRVVGAAKDGTEAVCKAGQLKPDCITLDLMMPGKDGLTTLKEIMSRCPTPCVILSAHSREGADITLECLEAGAVGFVLKPTGELSLDIERVKHQLISEVKAAAQVRLKSIESVVSGRRRARGREEEVPHGIIVMGASTGGPHTLDAILPHLPVELSWPVIIVQHMPSAFFSRSLAERLDHRCTRRIKVAENGDALRTGVMYVAPAECDLTLHGCVDTEVRLHITPVRGNDLTPSIDVTMASAARIFTTNAMGVILSGMGGDGREGMRAIKEFGGTTIVQDKSSLVFGMPQAVIDAGLADRILPAERIADALADGVSRTACPAREREVENHV